MTLPILTLLATGLVSFLLLAALHWGSRQLIQADTPFWSYVAGTLCIGAVFGGWCLCQPAPVPAWYAFIAWATCAIGAGLGTVVGHAIDHWAAQQRIIRSYEVEHEGQRARRTGTD